MNEKSELISKLQEDVKFRAAYIRSKLNLLIPSQLRGLRLNGKLTQKQLAAEADMKQPRISAMERPGEIQFSLETLIRMAAAHRVGLQVKFVPYSELLRWENGYRQDDFKVATLDEDEEFTNPEPQREEDGCLIASSSDDGNNEGVSLEAQDETMMKSARKPPARELFEQGKAVGGI